MSLAGEETEAQFRARHPNSDAGGDVQEAPRLEIENRGYLILPSSKPSPAATHSRRRHICAPLQIHFHREAQARSCGDRSGRLVSDC